MLTTEGIAFFAASARLAIFGAVHGDRRLLHQHDVVLAGESREQVRTQRGDDEQRCDADGGDLREK